MTERDIDDISGEIVDAAYQVHTRMGPGLLESVYSVVMARALERRGLKVERDKAVTFEFDGVRFERGLRVELLVEDRVVVELKSVETFAPVHAKQVLTYLRLLNLPVADQLRRGDHPIRASAGPRESKSGMLGARRPFLYNPPETLDRLVPARGNSP